MTESYYRYWGKAEKGGTSWHPALCHMLDAGIVARELLASMPEKFNYRLEKEFSVDSLYLSKAIGFLTSVHDIGKISPGFQAKRIDLCGNLKNQGFRFSKVDETRHNHVTLDVLPELLANELDCTMESAIIFSQLLAAHHGSFLGGDGISSGSEQWDQARKGAVLHLAGCFGIETLSPIRTPTTPILMLLAGLIGVADWLASAEEFFPYLNGQPLDVQAYMSDRVERARTVVQKLKFNANRLVPKQFTELFNFDAPNSCQTATVRVVENLQHPMLVVIESPMGSGKTEAAQAAYARLGARDALRGMYYALPTQATGNAMLPRMKKFLNKLGLEKGAELHLLHTNADLNTQYEQLKIAGVEAAEGNVTASSWFTARKRGLLAGYGVGTIDQALLAALKARHFFVRLFGLSGKLVVLDEVHAYDAYMVEEIYRLIGWLAHCDTSIFLLSATLPKARREKLVKAFNPGVEFPGSIAYPCVFGVDGKGEAKYEPIQGLKDDTISMVPMVTPAGKKYSSIAAILSDKLANGGCAACIMNTVSEAQSLYETLKREINDADILLFHSRFTLNRKLKIEKALLGRYDKEGCDRPHKGIVVATQVVEQSLDVDFDLMITDIAPIDLLLQRAGRLHRHQRMRPELLKERILHVLLPDLSASIPEFGDSGKVYAPDILLRSGLLFLQDGNNYQTLSISVPYGVSSRIEAVYGEEGRQAIPQHLVIVMNKWEKKRIEEDEGDAFGAKYMALAEAHSCTPDYLGLLANDFDDERIAVTRLTRQNITLIVLEECENTIANDKARIRDLYSRSLTTDNPKVVEHFNRKPIPKEWGEAPLLRNCRPFFIGSAGAAVDGLGLSYDDEFGLRIPRSNRR